MPVTPATTTPSPPLPETTLRAAGSVPPTWLPLESSRTTPAPALPRSDRPDVEVPTKLPPTPLAGAPSSTIPSSELPDTRLQTPVHGPPGVVPTMPPTVTWAFLIVSAAGSWSAYGIGADTSFGIAAIPAESVPIRFPATRWPLAVAPLERNHTPPARLPEMTLPDREEEPPTRTASASTTWMPGPSLGSATLPVASSPIQFCWITYEPVKLSR